MTPPTEISSWAIAEAFREAHSLAAERGRKEYDVAYNFILDRARELDKQEGRNEDAIENVLHKIDQWCRAYPEDMFPEPDEDDLSWLNERRGLRARISASMGRHMVKHMREMADAIRGARELDKKKPQQAEGVSESYAKRVCSIYEKRVNDVGTFRADRRAIDAMVFALTEAKRDE